MSQKFKNDHKTNNIRPYVYNIFLRKVKIPRYLRIFKQSERNMKYW